MASKKNDALNERTVEGPINLYDEQRSKGTANDKGVASRLGGHDWNILNNSEKDEIYCRDQRNGDHYIDRNNRNTNKWFDRKKKYPRDPRSPVRRCMNAPEDHPKVFEAESRRIEMQLVQMENPQNFSDFQRRRHEIRPGASPRPNRRNLNDIERKLNATRERTKEDYLDRVYRKGTEPELTRPKTTNSNGFNNSITNSHRSPSDAFQSARSSVSARSNYPHVHQLLNESAAFASCKAANTYTHSVHTTGAGKQLLSQQIYKSGNRIPDYDFSIRRKNNNFSNENKLNRSDMFYARPRLGIQNNSVKYNIINNKVNKFMYS